MFVADGERGTIVCSERRLHAVRTAVVDASIHDVLLALRRATCERQADLVRKAFCVVLKLVDRKGHRQTVFSDDHDCIRAQSTRYACVFSIC